MYLLAIHGSPRKNGNTEILLDYFLKGINQEFISFEKIRLSELKYQPCIECGECETKGECVLEDDFKELYYKIFKADFIVVATPIFFYSHTSYVHAFFERFQALWARKYILKLPHPFNKKPKGILLGLGGTKGKKLFECVIRSFKYVLDAVYGIYLGGLFFRGIDKRGEILNYPEYLELARDVGFKLSTLPEKEILESPEKLNLNTNSTP
ncbi:MAG: flavodoxin family protein [Thermodesulfobacterium geofontis]|uniref:Flavodoxin family protein n=1 Tax=Thermodesulfobacterium geofontis TaxID=1295609 RepID=A0A2N7PQ19_9BACT|nr:MAG: flavodoxin family protein [Thermodesulfobacterium geofontis]PMP93518.1 MAG: flavodoxin family protein [Thermodesulfobacterium geofontis]